MPINLRSLRDELQHHLQQVAPQFAPHRLELLAHGEANAIFRLNDAQLVRVAVHSPNQRFGGDAQRLTQFEGAVLTYLQDTQITHDLQQISQPDQTFPFSYLITNFLNGDALNYSPAHLRKAAQTLATLHRLPLQKGYAIDRLRDTMPVIEQPLTLFYTEAQAYAQPYLESSAAEPEIVEMLRSVLDKANSKLSHERLLQNFPYICLAHSDHTYDNWVIDDDRAYLIDWEWAELSSPAGDLGHFLSPVTTQRHHDRRFSAQEREEFLQTYYKALADEALIETVQHHFAAFGVFPAVRSICWTAGYWITGLRWYAGATDDSPSAAQRQQRYESSRRRFPDLWQAVMQWLEEE